jgi:HPr kinase/phosphorylase
MIDAGPPPSVPPPSVECTVADLAQDARVATLLRRAAGDAGLDRPVRHPRVQKSGLALAGHFHGVVPTRVQVLGETELSFLDSMGGEARSLACRGYFSLGLSAVVLTRNSEPPRALVTAAEATSTPLFVSESRSSRTINVLHAVLDDLLAPNTSIHGVLVDVYGVGLLVMGKSGIGKSECALELVLRGHRLVADDVVKCDWRPPGMVFGAAADLLRHHIEVRGLGVLNIKDLFGVTSVRERKRIDVVVRLVDWKEDEEYDRLGLEENYHVILGTPIRLRNELLRRTGMHTAREFVARLESQLGAGLAIPDDMPESVAGPPVTAVEHHSVPPPPPTLVQNPSAPGPSGSPIPVPWNSNDAPRREDLLEHAHANESSAWIPVVKPRGDVE